MRTANTLSYVFAALFAVSTLASTAFAQDPPAGEQPAPSGDQMGQGMGQQGMGQPPSAMMAEKMTMTATVEKIDKQNRRLTLRDAQGKQATVTVPPEVKRFDQMKKGDQVNIAYYESVGLSLKKAEAGAQPSAKETIGTTTTAGKLPGGMAARSITLNAMVDKVDMAENEVMIKAPDGSKHAIHVTDPAMQKELSNIKPGDVVQVNYTEAMAINVEPAKKPQQKG